MPSPKKRDKPEDVKAASDDSSDRNTEAVLKPFQEAAAQFAQANSLARESAYKEYVQKCLNFQEEVSRHQHEAYKALMDANKRYLETLGQTANLETLGQTAKGSVEEIYAARAQAQVEYAKAVGQIHEDTQTALGQRSSGDEQAAMLEQWAAQGEKNYAQYVENIRQALSEADTIDPQALNAIAFTILSTLNSGH